MGHSASSFRSRRDRGGGPPLCGTVWYGVTRSRVYTRNNGMRVIQDDQNQQGIILRVTQPSIRNLSLRSPGTRDRATKYQMSREDGVAGANLQAIIGKLPLYRIAVRRMGPLDVWCQNLPSVESVSKRSVFEAQFRRKPRLTLFPLTSCGYPETRLRSSCTRECARYRINMRKAPSRSTILKKLPDTMDLVPYHPQ